MGFLVRTLDEISRGVRGAFRQYLPGTDASLKQNVLYVIGKAVSLLAREYELRFGWLHKQMFLWSATEPQWVELHASSVNIWRKAASASRGVIVGQGSPGVVYPAGIRFSSARHTFLTVAPATADGAGLVMFAVICEQAEASTNREPGAVLNLADPALYPTLGQEFAAGENGLGGGADVETTESLRARAMHRKRNPPGAGKLSDYEAMVLAVPGVVRAWAFRVAASPGAITVLFLFEGRPNLMPLAGDVATVQAAIDAQRLIRVDAGEASAPVALPVPVTISGLTPDTAEIRAAIEANIKAMLLTRCRPGVASDQFIVSKSWFAEAISAAIGEDRHTMTAPVADILLTGGQFPVLGAVTYA